jgi:tripartite-type tricarboxylate transporter receptor subunit TctC
MSWIITTALALTALLAGSTATLAQSGATPYPAQTVRIVVPVSPGSIADSFARSIAEKLSDIWKQQVIVENRPGLPGAASVAKSPPDGYTLFLNSNGHTIAGAINRNLPYDPVKDFAGVTLVASVPLVMIVPPSLPARTVREFIALAKDRPGQFNAANAGVSTTSFLSAEIFRRNAGIALQHVPYRGAPEAVTAVVRGDAHLFFAPIPPAQELGAAGKVAVIAINSATRAPQMLEVPTVAESGLPEFRYESWFGMLAPAGVPRTVLQKVSADIGKVLNLTDVRERMHKLGAVPSTSTPEQFDVIIKNDTERNSRIVREAGVEAK